MTTVSLVKEVSAILRERGYRIKPATALPDDGYRAKIGEWFRESGEVDEKILILAEKEDGRYLIYDEELSLIATAHLFPLGSGIEISVERQIEVRELDDKPSFREIEDLAEKLIVAMEMFHLI